MNSRPLLSADSCRRPRLPVEFSIQQDLMARPAAPRFLIVRERFGKQIYTRSRIMKTRCDLKINERNFPRGSPCSHADNEVAPKWMLLRVDANIQRRIQHPYQEAPSRTSESCNV